MSHVGGNSTPNFSPSVFFVGNFLEGYPSPSFIFVVIKIPPVSSERCWGDCRREELEILALTPGVVTPHEN
jgi:hypothetical protein